MCDEGRRIERDFTCHKNTLLREMRYFESYLTGSHSSEDIDISVHCDVHIFDWLVQYMHKDGTAPKLGMIIYGGNILSPPPYSSDLVPSLLFYHSILSSETEGRHELTTNDIPYVSPTHIDSNSVISILISSEFLQMHNLVNKCLQYTHDAISEIIALPIVSDRVTDCIY